MFERKEQRKKEAADAGVDYVSDEDKGEDVVPWITKDMLQKALNVARRSVSKQDLERYMKYKRDMERRLGMDDDAPAGAAPARVIGLDAENRHGAAPAAAAPVFAGADAAPRTFNDAGAAGADDDDDIYE